MNPGILDAECDRVRQVAFEKFSDLLEVRQLVDSLQIGLESSPLGGGLGTLAGLGRHRPSGDQRHQTGETKGTEHAGEQARVARKRARGKDSEEEGPGQHRTSQAAPELTGRVRIGAEESEVNHLLIELALDRRQPGVELFPEVAHLNRGLPTPKEPGHDLALNRVEAIRSRGLPVKDEIGGAKAQQTFVGGLFDS